MLYNTAISGFGTYLPQNVYDNEQLRSLGYEFENDEPFFKGVERRHWANEKETSVYMGAQAISQLLENTGTLPSEIDLIISSSLIGDSLLPNPSCGIQYAIGATNASAITIDTGCTSFISGLIYGCALVRAGVAKKIALVSISNFAGRAQSQLKNPSSTIPGDGAAAVLITATAPLKNTPQQGILGYWERSFGEYHQLFGIHPLDKAGIPTKLWKPHERIAFWFDPTVVETIKKNARELVPMAAREAMNNAGLTPSDIDLLFTHQPNRYLLDFWSQEIGFTNDRHHETLANHGNLFQASIPMSMAIAYENGHLKSGDTALLSSFAFAGELAASAVIRLS